MANFDSFYLRYESIRPSENVKDLIWNMLFRKPSQRLNIDDVLAHK